MAREPPRPGREVPLKSTLFCVACGHQAPVDGDWTLDSRPRGTQYRCPDCEATITIRESFTGSERGVYTNPYWVLWGDSVRVWRDFWQEVIGTA